MIDILIIDDETESYNLLKIMLRSYKGINILGHATNVDEGIKFTLELQPDLVLLDIQMPGKDGFEYIKELRDRELHHSIIFITAHEHYAIQAIRSAAFDYLMKPIGKEELFSAIQRFEDNQTKNSRNDLLQLAELINARKPEKMRLNIRTGYVFINPLEIVYIEADGNYSNIQLINDRIEVSTMSLGSIEQRLESEVFLRISRSFIVNMNLLSRVDRKENTCELEYNGKVYKIKIPPGKIKLLEAYF